MVIRRFRPCSAPFSSAVVTPDGKSIAYSIDAEDGAIWVRDLSSEEPRKLEGTEGAAQYGFFWSPDSRWLGFAVGHQLKKILVDRGPPVTLCDFEAPWDRGTWSPDGGWIAFGAADQIYEVRSDGGEAQLLFDAEQTTKGSNAIHPDYLPSGSNSLLYAVGPPGDHDIAIINLENGEVKALAEGSHPRYSPTGHVVFEKLERGTHSLWAMPFSLETLEAQGVAFPVVQDARRPSVSSDGTSVHERAASDEWRRLVWRDRSGQGLGQIGQLQQNIHLPALSPDDRWVAVAATEGGNRDIWLHSVDRGTKERLTADPSIDTRPQWSPSGTDVTFWSARDGGLKMWHRSSGGTGEAKLLEGAVPDSRPWGWSKDGTYLLYTVRGEQGSWDLGYLKRQKEGEGYESFTLLATAFSEKAPQLSSSERFVAYCSNETGEYEVYVRSLPSGERRTKISRHGGTQPRWSRDGTELFYVEGDRLMAVQVRESPGFDPGTTTDLFSDAHLLAPSEQISYDVSLDGRFVLVDDAESAEPSALTIHVVENWYEEFRGRE